ncbi:aldo/keto reductase [Candidatus Bathyarchaeota archaeon]|nr:aldo/keto reductase [Candidatus Bathyarchaeota archaeon]
MRQVELGNTGEKVAVVGQGTWGVKRNLDASKHQSIKESLKLGIELGMTHIDTAEAYGSGAAELLIGELIKEEQYDRDDLFITSKIFPLHFTKESMKRAARRSLSRLGLNHFDLYLIHMPNPVIPLKWQVHLMEELIDEGLTRYMGVSNFFKIIFKFIQFHLKKYEFATNQVRINIGHQGYIHHGLDYFQARGVTLTAYSPLAHGKWQSWNNVLMQNLSTIAKAHDATPSQVAIAWLIHHDGIITIPKAFSPKHVIQNAGAADLNLSKREIQSLYMPSKVSLV